ncbi:glycine zipper 2TM domain-containing protein [Niveispirillum sp. KHB5.9]|uniref:glycine zipper 2TM domain-containing protein n=1 Tax=Niveispirillum sp. KHB5.9 TaxID=3400269 RepID=UPI003A87B6F8
MRKSLPFAAATAALLALAPVGEALADRDDDRHGRHHQNDDRGRDRDRGRDHDRDRGERHDQGRGPDRDRPRHDHYRPAPPPHEVHHHHHRPPPPPPPRVVHHHYRPAPPPVVHYHVVQPQHWHGHYGNRWRRLPEFYSMNVGIDRGRCDRRAVNNNVGTLLGAVAGGLAGSTIGDGRGQVAATLGGVLVGAAIGSSLSSSYSHADYGCAVQTFERAPTGQAVMWDDPDRDARYTLTPTRTYEASSGRYCREYTSQAQIGGRTQSTYGTACRQPDGSWEIVG